jgi:NhaA family Na+:H+ antiporter
MVAAIAAIVWANSPWRSTYENLWHFPFSIGIGSFSFQRDLHFLINEGLMTVFFFLVGLEIRREIHAGELSEVRRAVLPLAAALGGMLVPAIIFVAFNSGRASLAGWAIPTATDIAFAVGALVLLGRRVSPALRILLLALAVIDDVGAIAVIALFYSASFNTWGFFVLFAGVLTILGMRMVGVRSTVAYVVPGLMVWAGAYLGGIHPTLAGVVVGFLTPVKAWYGTEGFLNEAERRVRSIRSDGISEDRELLPHLDTLRVATREAVSPVERLQHALHGWVAFCIMPLFAFANAGVSIGQVSFSGDARRVFLGIVLGLVVGKPIGILGFSWISVRLRAASLPRGVVWRDVSVVGLVGGIGFTMSLFIAQLAFPAGGLLEIAKIAILCGSGIAAGISLVAGYRVLKTNLLGASTDAEAEASTLN